MKHVVSFDVSMRISTMIMYDRYRRCEFEREIEHTNSAFKRLNEILQILAVQDEQAPIIVFEVTGVYSKALERFFQREGYAYLQLSIPELERLFSTRFALLLNIIQLYPYPIEVLTCSKKVIRNRLKANTRKDFSLARAENKGMALLQAAKDSCPAISKKDVRCEKSVVMPNEWSSYRKNERNIKSFYSSLALILCAINPEIHAI